MKKGLILLLSLFFAALMSAQHIPMGINYQAIARDNAGNELKSKNLSIRISILSENPSGIVEYAETHSVTTDPFGLFKLVIGEGSWYAGSVSEFSAIAWGASSHFLRVEVNFGDGFISMGSMPFQAVPYALYAANAGDTGGEKDLDKDPSNEIQTLSLAGKTLSISQGNSVTLSEDIVNDADANPTNELQDLRLEGNMLRLSPPNADPTSVDLGNYLDNTDDQQLSVDTRKNQLSITNGNGPVNIDADTTNELQQLNLVGYDLSLSKDGGKVNIKPEIIAFRAKKLPGDSQTLQIGEEKPLIFKDEIFDTGGNYNQDNGTFIVPPGGDGLYFFEVNYNFNSSHILRIILNSELYETIFEGVSDGIAGFKSFSFILMLSSDDFVNINLYNPATPSFSGSGSFFGYRIH
jgi:hypothetical protein